MTTAPIRARFTTWDDRPRWTYWLTDPRCELGQSVSALGGAIARLGNRIHDDAPGDFWQGVEDEARTALAVAAEAERRRRPAALALLERLGVDTGPETLAKLGWSK